MRECPAWIWTVLSFYECKRRRLSFSAKTDHRQAAKERLFVSLSLSELTFYSLETSQVRIYRYDSYEASRRIPNLNEIMKGKVQVEDGEQFSINVDEKKVFIGKQEVFDRLVYFTD